MFRDVIFIIKLKFKCFLIYRIFLLIDLFIFQRVIDTHSIISYKLENESSSINYYIYSSRAALTREANQCVDLKAEGHPCPLRDGFIFLCACSNVRGGHEFEKQMKQWREDEQLEIYCINLFRNRDDWQRDIFTIKLRSIINY